MTAAKQCPLRAFRASLAQGVLVWSRFVPLLNLLTTFFMIEDILHLCKQFAMF
jgi:hypothetical protein